MESVLLGMAAPAAVGTAGSLLSRTLQAAAEPFAALLGAITAVEAPERDNFAAGTTDKLQGRLDTLLGELANSIEHALTSAGIDLSEPIGLRLSETDGRLEVAGDHRQKPLIEAALADLPDLAERFADVATLTQVLAARDKLNTTDSADGVALGHTEPVLATALFSANGDGATLRFRPAVAA